MGLLEVQQSLPLMLVFAILAGLSLTLATACTHYPSHIDRQVEEQEASKLQELSSSLDDPFLAHFEDFPIWYPVASIASSRKKSFTG